MARSNASSFSPLVRYLAGIAGISLLPLLFGMSARRVEAPKPVYSYADCRDHFGELVFGGQSAEWKEAQKVKLRIIPFAKSDYGNTIDELKDAKKWLGVIANYGTKPSGRYKVPANIFLPVCIRMEGNGTNPQLLLVYPDNHSEPKSFLGCPGESGGRPGPHADWKHEGDCARYLEFAPGGSVEVLTDPKVLHDIMSGSAAWVSCASNGCCRVQP